MLSLLRRFMNRRQLLSSSPKGSQRRGEGEKAACVERKGERRSDEKRGEMSREKMSRVGERRGGVISTIQEVR